jgi:hypothetical protein
VVEVTAKELVTHNPSPIDLDKELEELVACHNAGAINPKTLFELLQDFVHHWVRMRIGQSARG